MYQNLIQPLENIAASVLDGVAELLGNKGAALSDPPTNGRVTLPDDLLRSDVQTEWWYYTGHCKTHTGREFGFELVFLSGELIATG